MLTTKPFLTILLRLLAVTLLALSGGMLLWGGGIPSAFADVAHAVRAAESGMFGSHLGEEVLSALRWFLIVEVLGVVVWPYIAWAFPMLPDRGWGLSKGVGLAWYGWTVWYLRSNELITHPVGAAVGVGALSLFVAGLFSYTHRTLIRSAVREARTTILFAEGLFTGAFILFAILKSFQPEIFWGEKPMDLSFLQYFVRVEKLPPDDPWAAGFSMHYYYLGYFIYALLVKVSGVAVGVGYNLALVTIASSLLSAVYSLILFLTRAPLFSTIGALLVFLSSNLEWVVLYFSEHRQLNFDLFWATTRLFTSPAFAEYPLWSFLFGDLHPHVIAQPLSVVVIVMALYLLIPSCERDTRSWAQMLVGYLFLGFQWNLLLPINTWDGTTALITVGVLAIFVAVVETSRSRALAGTLASRIFRLGGIGLVLYTMGWSIAPYLATFPQDRGWNWITDREFNSAWQLLRHTGAWLVPSIIVAAILLFIRLSGGAIAGQLEGKTGEVQKPPVLQHPYFAAVGWALIVSIPLIYSSFASVYGRALPPSGIVVGGAAVCGVLLLLTLLSRRDDELDRSVSLLLGGIALMVAAEVVYIVDRMNTIFKFYQLVWALLACGSVGVIHVALRWRGRLQSASARVLLSGALLCAAVPLLVALIGGYLMTGIMISFQRIPGPRPTLNGQAYLRQASPDEATVFEWIQKNVAGSPVLLEAWGDSYRDFTRGSMNTGLPVVLGWEYHVQQRGAPIRETARRKSNIEEMYQSPSIERRLSLLRYYNVRYILAGDLERNQYTHEGVRLFSQYPSCFKTVAAQNSVQLFEFKRDCVPMPVGAPPPEG